MPRARPPRYAAPVADDFLDVATEDRAAADARLRDDPGLETASPFHALVLGHADAVAQALQNGSVDVRAATAGPLAMPALAYVCFSRYAQRDSPRAPALIETARLLLARGADPNATFEMARYPGNPFPCLYGATGYNNNPALARVLIDGGARVDDDESIYHSTEHPDLECLRLLLERRPRIREHVLKHMLDREDVAGAALLLDAGADPNETNGRHETALHWAVWRDRSPAMVRLLLAHRAATEARRIDGRTAYAMAVLFGREALADTLRDAGANTALGDVDRYLLACAGQDAAGPQGKPPKLTSADAHLLPDLADAGHTAAVLGLLAADVGVQATGEHGATALHFACWRGHDALVAPLLARGADTTRTDRTFQATPPGWLLHGARFCDAPRGDYAASLRALFAAGATVTADAPTGRPEVDAILRERGVLR